MSKVISYLDWSGLLNVAVSDFNKPLNEFSACKNVYEYKIGMPEKVPGYTHIGEQILASEINTLYYYYQQSAKTNYLLAGMDSTTNYALYYTTTGSFSAVSTGSTYTGKAGMQLAMATYIDKAFIVGYKTGDSSFATPATLTGTTFSTVDANLTNMPAGKYLVVYRDLLYVLNCKISSTLYPSRAYFCGEPIGGAITWTQATDFLPFGQEDGDEITGATVAYDRLIVFKNYSMWKYDENSVIRVADVGCDSYKSIISINGVPYWFNRLGIYRWGGALPQLISSKVQPFIDAITQSAFANVIAVQHEFEYRVHIGTVTVENITYTNCWLCFDVRKEKWYVRCTVHTPRSAAQFIISSIKRAYFGTTTGFVQKFATKVDGVYSDDGSEIDSFFITNNYDFGDPSCSKFNTHVGVFSRNCQGLKIAVDADNTDEFQLANFQFTGKDNEDFNITTIGIRYRFKIFEKSANKSWEFEGMAINSMDLIEDRN